MKISETMRKQVAQTSITTLLVGFCASHDPALSDEWHSVDAAKKPSAIDAGVQGRVHWADDRANGGAGMIIYWDPKTGTIAEPPSAALEALSDRGVEDVKFPSIGVDDLEELQSTTPGGGYMVHLKGRYMTPLTISRHPDGRFTVQHRSEAFMSDPELENADDSSSK